jgi:hypothetical protein
VPHFVGRGGLGAVLGALGLKAVAVLAPPLPERADPELTRLLLRSPRLAARAQGGTLELFESAAAAGEAIERDDARAVASAIAGAEREPHGCRGCPTPCGWSFAGLTGMQGARFGATRALGVDLGLASFEDALALLARCDALGLDAKEAGAVLALRAGAHGMRGDRAAFERALDGPARGEGPGAHGAAVLARELGVQGAIVKGQAARASANLAALLGQCVASRGADPMRSFPFLRLRRGRGTARRARRAAPDPSRRRRCPPRSGGQGASGVVARSALRGART